MNDMHKLGDQWIEIIDGQEHMMKAVVGPCERCDVSHLCNLSSDCPMDWGLVAKDLGILKDGLLPTPWDEKQYPQQEIYRGEWSYYAKGSGVTMRATGKTKQQAIDAWNRRS